MMNAIAEVLLIVLVMMAVVVMGMMLWLAFGHFLRKVSAKKNTFKTRKFRCPKGHEWEDFGTYDFLFYTQEGYAYRSGHNCPICLVEFFRQFPAEEVK